MVSQPILDTIRNELKKLEINFREVHHAPTYTSQDSALARGEPLEVGGKALLIKVDSHFYLFVLSANKKIDSTKIRSYFHAQSVRFATKEELFELTGLVPGCVPPFGHPVLPFDLFVDLSITEKECIAFNSGSLTDSIVMNSKDYIKVAKPTLFSFSDSS